MLSGDTRPGPVSVTRKTSTSSRSAPFFPRRAQTLISALCVIPKAMTKGASGAWNSTRTRFEAPGFRVSFRLEGCRSKWSLPTLSR